MAHQRGAAETLMRCAAGRSLPPRRLMAFCGSYASLIATHEAPAVVESGSLATTLPATLSATRRNAYNI